MYAILYLASAPISETEGEGFMRGQMLAKPVKIITARRLPDSVPVPAL